MKYMNMFKGLKEAIYKESTSFERVIVGIWAIDCLYNPQHNERVFKYKIIIVQSNIGQGCAYSTCKEYSVDYLESLIGRDCLDIEFEDMALNVACMDSMSGNISYGYEVETKILEGISNDKLHMRSTVIVQEAERLIGCLTGKKILNVGVVGDIILKFCEKGCDVIGSDFDEQIIGKKIFDGVPIKSGDYTLELISGVDLAVVTGMTITTKTLDSIIEVCKNNDVKLIVFAETGSNMGQYYVHMGVDCYIGEEYPFYIFNGRSIITITRK